MKSNECLNILMQKIKNKEPLKLDLEDIVLDLIYDKDLDNYRGLWKEENKGVGIWTKEIILKIASGEIKGVKVLL